MQFLFPAVPSHKCDDQFNKVREELEEIETAPDDENMLLEYFDTLHALEQIGRKIHDRVGAAKFWNGRDAVLTKNYGRGLYANN